jgi:hypothetical protein
MSRRHHQRGAAGLEAAVVVVLLASVAAGTIFVWRTGRTAIRVSEQAREEAWDRAVQGCEDSDPILADLDDSLALPRRIANAPSLQRPLSTSLGVARAETSGAVHEGTRTLAARGSAIVHCKELPSSVSPSDERRVIDALFDSLF